MPFDFFHTESTEGNHFIGFDLFSVDIYSYPEELDPIGTRRREGHQAILLLLRYRVHPRPHPVLPHAPESIRKAVR